IDFRHLVRMAARFCLLKFGLKRRHESIDRYNTFRRQVSLQSGDHDEGAISLCRILVMLRLSASFRRQSREVPVARLDDKLASVRRVHDEIWRESADRSLRREF